MDRNVRQKSDRRWSDLPPELLSAIANRLDNSPDVQQFRSVCKSWGSSVNPPFLCLSPLSDAIYSCITARYPPNPRFLAGNVPVATAVYVLHPKPRDLGPSWLVRVDQTTHGKVRLVDPITMRPFEITKKFPRVLTNDIVYAQEITRGFDYRFIGDRKRWGTDFKSSDLFCVSSKILLWPNPRMESPRVEDYKMMMLVKKELMHGEATHVTVFKDGPNEPVKGLNYKIDDMILWNRGVWAVDRKGRLYELDFSTMGVNTVTATATLVDTKKVDSKRLFEYQGELYMIARQGKGASFFLKVYKLHKEFRIWEYVENFDDKVLFVGVDICFFAPAIGKLEEYRNCSIFPVNKFVPGMSKYGEGANSTNLTISLSEEFDAFWPPLKWIMDLASSKP